MEWVLPPGIVAADSPLSLAQAGMAQFLCLDFCETGATGRTGLCCWLLSVNTSDRKDRNSYHGF